MSEELVITPRQPVVVNIEQGVRGDAATISIGTVTTGAVGADAEVTNSGTSNAAVLDFVLPLSSTRYNVDAGTPYSIYGGLEENIDGGGP